MEGIDTMESKDYHAKFSRRDSLPFYYSSLFVEGTYLGVTFKRDFGPVKKGESFQACNLSYHRMVLYNDDGASITEIPVTVVPVS